MTMFSIWCEWDIGQEYYVFTTEDKALKWLNEHESIKDICRTENCTVASLIDDGLVTLNEIDVDP